MPARKIGPKKGVNRRCLVSRTTEDEKMVFSESLLERDFIKLCNCLPTISRIEYQPLCIAFNYRGERRKYYPDFLLTEVDGKKILVEIKPLSRTKDQENLIKFKVGELFCEEKGWSFKVITDRDLYEGQLKYNVSLLLDAKRLNIDIRLQYAIYELFHD
ncbi:Tn7 transposase TnsA N-terminal domain-containing protein [Paenibacillus sp. MAH-36]|uniref:Tn7 transposase TnsA N-terminal domain-containing protein n=1 Tax=Paenibacillus sp. GCM10012304 TaxID=3317341 RepID=UPI003619CA9C